MEDTLQSRRLANRLADLLEHHALADRTVVVALRIPGDGLTNVLDAPLTCRANAAQLFRCQKRSRAVHADEVAHLFDDIEELVEIHRTSQTDVTEMTRTVLVCLLAGRADLAILNDTELGVKDAARNRLTALVGLVCRNLDHTALDNVVGARNAELNAYDCVAHDAYLLCSMYILFRFTPQAVVSLSKIHRRGSCAWLPPSHDPPPPAW